MQIRYQDACADHEFSGEWEPGVSPTQPVTYFCFSALTGNPHRIHYDADYARITEV